MNHTDNAIERLDEAIRAKAKDNSQLGMMTPDGCIEFTFDNSTENDGEAIMYCKIGKKQATKLVFVYETATSSCHIKGKLYRGHELQLYAKAVGKLTDPEFFADF